MIAANKDGDAGEEPDKAPIEAAGDLTEPLQNEILK